MFWKRVHQIFIQNNFYIIMNIIFKDVVDVN